jgi:acyl-CoA synthetase (AMP-forming)/AMP-acid ligase II
MSIFGMEVIARAGRPPGVSLDLAASGTQLRKWVEGWGTEVISMYGSSETVAPPIVGSTFEGVPEGYIGSVTPFYSVRVVPESESSGPVQGALEVLGLPGRTMAAGYMFADGSFHSLDLTGDGWFRTGDVVECDEAGWIRFLGRADDVLKVRGENVSPAEIEGAIRGSTGVEDVAVVGVSDVVWGHIPVAVLELLDDAPREQVTESVLAQLQERLSGHKHPLLLLATEQLPRSNLNKVRKSVVRESLETYDELWRSSEYHRGD